MLTALFMVGFVAAVATPAFVMAASEDDDGDLPEAEEETQSLDALLDETMTLDPEPTNDEPDVWVADVAVPLAPGAPDALDTPSAEATGPLAPVAPSDPDAPDTDPDLPDLSNVVVLRPEAADLPDEDPDDEVDHIHDFVPGEDVLRVTFFGEASMVDIEVEPTSEGDAAIVSANGIPIAILHGAREAAEADLDIRFVPEDPAYPVSQGSG